MPDDALSVTTQSALSAAVRAYAAGEAGETETRQALAPMIGLPVYDAGLSAYLDVLLRRIATGEITRQDAVCDMAEVARAARRYDPNLRNFLVLGAE